MRPAPPQRHGRRRVAVARPDTAKQDRRPAPDATLWRQLPHELYPSAPPPCAPYRPDRTHSRPPSRRTGRSYRPHPLHRGAPQRHHRVLSPPAARNSAQAPVRSEFVLTADFGGRWGPCRSRENERKGVGPSFLHPQACQDSIHSRGQNHANVSTGMRTKLCLGAVRGVCCIYQ